MKCRIHSVSYGLLVVICILLVGHSAFGSSSGLNNIPTTDIVPEEVLVFQTWANAGYNRYTQNFVGFKYGLFKDIEIGLDWKANDATHCHAMFQGKYAFDIDGDALRGVVGIADLSDHKKHNGEVFPYSALSLDLEKVRLHFGFAAQPHNEAFFGGFDKTVDFLDRDLQFRFDGIHINDMEDMKLSAGFIYNLAPKTKTNSTPSSGLGKFLSDITKNMLIESWVTMPTTGNQEVYTVKLNYVIKF